MCECELQIFNCGDNQKPDRGGGKYRGIGDKDSIQKEHGLLEQRIWFE